MPKMAKMKTSRGYTGPTSVRHNPDSQRKRKSAEIDDGTAQPPPKRPATNGKRVSDDLPDEYNEEEVENEEAATQKVTEEDNLARRINEAENNTDGKRILRTRSKNPGNETYNNGAAATHKKTEKTTKDRQAKAPREDNGEGPSKGPPTAPSRPTKENNKNVFRKSSSKGKKDNDPLNNRSRAKLEAPKVPRAFDIRRILAQRKVGTETFYNVDWFPCWVKARSVQKPVIDEWNANGPKSNGAESINDRTLEWGHDTVYRVDNPTSDDSPEHARVMMEGVFQKYTEYMNRTGADLAMELFKKDDWEFLDPSEQKKAVKAATQAGSPHPSITAAEVMQRIFVVEHDRVRTNRTKASRHYDRILVQYTGEIDKEATSYQYQPQEGMAATGFIDAIFEPEFWNTTYMDATTWDASDVEGMRNRLVTLQDLTASLVNNCPYLLQHAWPLMFISLFHWEDEVKTLIAKSDFKFDLVGEHADPTRWAMRVRDELIYTYMDECEWEMRCADEIATSFAAAQDTIQSMLDEAKSASDDHDDQNDGLPNPDDVSSEGRAPRTDKGKQPAHPRSTRTRPDRHSNGVSPSKHPHTLPRNTPAPGTAASKASNTRPKGRLPRGRRSTRKTRGKNPVIIESSDDETEQE